MPPWVISLLISLAVKWGAMWLLKRFPGLPDAVKLILQLLVDNLKLAKNQKGALSAEYQSYEQSEIERAKKEIADYYKGQK